MLRFRPPDGVPVRALLPDRTVRTLYGVRWEGRSMAAESIHGLALDAGFTSAKREVSSESFYLTFAREVA